MKQSRILPFLVAMYPMVYVCAYIVGVPRSIEFAVDAAVLFLVTTLIVGLLQIVLRDRDTAPFIATFFLMWMFSYASARALVVGRTVFGIRIWSHTIAIPLWLAVLGLGLALIPFKIAARPNAVRSLNVFAVLLLLLPIGSGMWSQRHDAPQSLPSSGDQTPPHVVQSNPPDIYFFLMDAYGGEKEFRSLLGFDNTKFLGELVRRGFTASERSYSNYPATYLSLAATLNMDYLASAPVGAGQYKLLQSPQEIVESIRHNTVYRYLQSAGYKLVDLSIWDEIRGGGKCQEPLENPFLNSFSLELINMTVLGKPIAQNLLWGLRNSRLDPCRLDAVREAIVTNGPKLVYVHLMLTHVPYMFTDGGEFLPVWQIVSQVKINRALYFSQVNFANSQLLNAIDQILSSSPRPPIIVVEGDHGPALMDPDAEGIRLRQSILNAWYLPDAGGATTDIPSSPINTFRFLLSRYVGFQLDPLDDRHFAADLEGKPRTLVDVTERLRELHP